VQFHSRRTLCYSSPIGKGARHNESGPAAIVGGRTIVVLVTWLALACAGVFAWGHLGSRLSGSVEIPGSPSQIATHMLQRHFDDSVEGSFTVLFEAPAARWGSPSFLAKVRSSVRRAGRAAGGGASPLHGLGARVSYAELNTELSTRAAQERAPDIRRATAREVHDLTGFAIGGVPPIGLRNPARVIMDPDLGRYPVVWAAAGLPTAVFGVPPGTLRILSNATVVPIAEEAAATEREATAVVGQRVGG